QTLRNQSCPSRQGQAKCQAPAQVRRLGPRLSRKYPRIPTALTRISEPWSTAEPKFHAYAGPPADCCRFNVFSKVLIIRKFSGTCSPRDAFKGRMRGKFSLPD